MMSAPVPFRKVTGKLYEPACSRALRKGVELMVLLGAAASAHPITADRGSRRERDGGGSGRGIQLYRGGS